MSVKSDIENQKNAGKLKGVGESVWHLNRYDNEYWCGSWHSRKPEELLKECQSIIADLIINHPELIGKFHPPE